MAIRDRTGGVPIVSKVNPPFRADQVGSLLRPAAVHEARAQRASGAISAAELREVEDAAIADAVGKVEGLGMHSWAYILFSSWVLPLFGYSQNVHTLHHLGMWYLLVFTIVHLYMVVREDAMSGETVISTMFSGWRVEKK